MPGCSVGTAGPTATRRPGHQPAARNERRMLAGSSVIAVADGLQSG